MLAVAHALLKSWRHNQPHRIWCVFTRSITAKFRSHIICRTGIHNLRLVEDTAGDLADVRVVGIVDVDLRYASATEQYLQKNEDDAHHNGCQQTDKRLFVFYNVNGIFARNGEYRTSMHI